MYTLDPSPKFLRKAKKLTKKNFSLKEEIENTLEILTNDPFFRSLETHKVQDINGNPAYSSKITGDLRIIWDFQNGQAKILDLIDIGGHSGKNKVYR